MLLLLTLLLSSPNFLSFPTLESPLPTALLEAQAQAEQQNKLILINWYNDWCPNCKKLDAFLERQPAFKARIEKDFIFIKLHCEQGDAVALANALNIRGWPHFTVYNHEFQLVERWIGFLHQAGFETRLDAILKDTRSLKDKWQAYQQEKTAELAASLGDYFYATNQHDLAKQTFDELALLEAEKAHHAFARSFVVMINQWSTAKNEESKETKLQSMLTYLQAYLAEDPNATLALSLTNDLLLYYKDDLGQTAWEGLLARAQPLLDQPFTPLKSGYLDQNYNESYHLSAKYSILSLQAEQQGDLEAAFKAKKQSLIHFTENPNVQGRFLFDWALQRQTHLHETLAFVAPIVASWRKGTPSNRMLTAVIKDAYIQLDEPQKALPMIAEVIEDYPDRHSGYLMNLEVYAALDDLVNVRTYAQKTLEVAKPKSLRNYVRLTWAEAEKAANKLTEAKEVLRETEGDGKYAKRCQALLQEIEALL